MTTEPYIVQMNAFFYDLPDTPPYWTNFVRSLSLPLVKSDPEYLNQITIALAEYNARFTFKANGGCIISFASEADYIHFLLKWT